MLCVQITLLHAPFAVDATKTSQGGGLAGNIFLCLFSNPDPAGNDHSVLGKASEAGTDARAYGNNPCLHVLVLASSQHRLAGYTERRAAQQGLLDVCLAGCR